MLRVLFFIVWKLCKILSCLEEDYYGHTWCGLIFAKGDRYQFLFENKHSLITPIMTLKVGESPDLVEVENKGP